MDYNISPTFDSLKISYLAKAQSLKFEKPWVEKYHNPIVAEEETIYPDYSINKIGHLIMWGAVVVMIAW
jgi:hypothetical protein